jgi:hypothetical protein
MATRNTAKYGGELARLLNALAGSSDNIVNTQDTLTDILEKVGRTTFKAVQVSDHLLNHTLQN